MKFLLVVSIFLSVQACAITPNRNEMFQSIESFNLPANPDPSLALVYMFRDESYSGFWEKTYIFISDILPTNLIDSNRGGEYTYFYVCPGQIDFFSTGKNPFDEKQIEEAASYSLETYGGKVYFLQQEYNMGWVSFSTGITLLDEIEGIYMIKTLSDRWKTTFHYLPESKFLNAIENAKRITC